MGKGRPRAVEKGGLGQGTTVSSSGLLGISPAPVYYPTEDEFKDPLGFIYKIREEAEQYGICKIVPPKNWKPPFALDLDSFTFPTKTQAIHQLQARPAACDSKTFELEYNRFLEEQCGRKSKKKVVFEGKDLDLCKLFNAVKRYGGYDNVVKDKKWSEVFRFVRSSGKISECAKHVLCQLYREHLFDYETYYNKLNRVKDKNCKRGMHVERKRGLQFTNSSSKRRRKNNAGGEIIERKLDDEEFDQICEQCSSGLHGEVMLLCDRCDKGWHIYCLSPPLKQVPPGNWYCAECVNSEKDSFGFVPGKHFSLEAFRRVADRAKKKWFGTTSPSRVQLEKKFWEIVGGSVGEVEVMYGSDLDTSVYGSGFPRVNDRRPESVDANEWDEYCASPWNLNNLPKLQGSMLRAVHHSIAGVMVPWLYMGMLFSSFCWHFEDHCFYSMNYHHWGEPKFWYSVPGSEACAFEKVMRNSLPDLFDAQPDLLFQLVTMLNPSVLLDNNVPVYSVLQEPGNFVITFPRSYHGGFNFGLNCAEAVNFAPPDWLPHGGFGAELYQLYHKPAVLSHEELLCVVAKSDFDSNVSPYLNKELLRIYNKERTWRERLWRNGMIKSSLMPPRKQPKHVGVEEDPTCIICLQFLYLSAVGCSCRPSAFVCLEHWEHICECKPLKRRLLYRHTLAELYDLVVTTEKHNSKETAPNKSTRMQLSCLSELPALSKKVKGGHATLVQLAEEWLQRSCKIVQTPYSRHAYKNALKEAEQFLWAGSEMDSVREMAKNLAEARSWAEGVKDCLSKIDSWLSQNNPKMERVKMEDVNSLLSVNPVPCNEPGHLKLKGYEETARLLIQEISVALSMRSHVSVVDWEALYSKACESPIYVNECEALRMKISAVKAWITGVRSCTSEKSSAIIGIDTLYDLKSKISVLQLELPEVDMLLDLMRKVEFCQSRCSEMLKCSITLKNLEVLVREYDGFAVSIPELELLKQYENDAVSWKSHFIDVLKNVHEREDQENVVKELTCIQKDGALLKVQVDELLEVEVELKKASCRLEAFKALRNKTSLDCLQKVMETAVKLQIEKEKLFVEISGILAAATSLEERAKHILASEAQMSEFEDVIRSSKDLCVLLPRLDDVKEAVSMAMSWLTRAKPYLVSDVSMVPVSSSLLKVDALKELVSESKLLKISLGERSMLEGALKTCVSWEDNACSILHDAESILDIDDIDDGSSTHIVSRIGDQVARMESVIKADLSLRFGFPVIHKLQDACSTLQWCLKVLSFRVVTPELEEVEMLLEVVNGQHVAYASRPLLRSLIDAVSWLKKALEVTVPCNLRIIKLSDVEEILRQSQKFNVSFPLMVGRLVDAVKRHNVWLDQVQVFFNLDSGDKSWPSLLQLEEHGSTDAFSCSEMDEVLCEVQKVKHWKQRCKDIVGPSMEDDSSLVYALLKIKEALDRSLCIYYKTNDRNTTSLCIFCSSVSEDQELLSCSACNDCYHMQCMKPILGGSSYVATCICPCCLAIDSGKYPRSILKVGGTRPELNMLTQLLSDAANLCVKIEERTVLNQIVERALECKACLTEIVDFAVSSIDEDFRTVVRKLSTALKAVEVAGIYDREGNSKLEQALARNSWRGRAGKLLEGSQKSSIQQIQRVLKEGLALSIPSEDHFWRRLVEIKDMGLQWAETAKKVSTDSGELELHKVFELIEHGSNLPVQFDKELKVLRERSMLYCICRKPYDQRAMIACDKCDEWYHFDCVKLSSTPKTYICPACKVETGEDNPTSSSMTTQERSNDECEKPQTPSPRPTGLRRGGSQKKHKSGTKQNVAESRDHSGIERLLWRNRKPFRRASRKRAQLDILSPFFYFT